MNEHDSLPTGMRFGELEILRVLGVGGFGIVYLARDHSLEREVALKEYMPASLATRGEGAKITVRSGAHAETYAVGLRSFVNEARLLAKFDHPSLVKVYRFWEANGTAYMVMPYLQGRTLRDARKAMSQAPDEAWMRSVLDPILGALEVLHREGVFHRDIAPDNILLQTDGPPTLLDFGAARRVISDRTQSLTAILKPSYAPIEQYAEMSALRQGPWTDLYALGAVAHFLLQGSPPGPATARALQDEMVPLWMRHFPGVSPRFLAAIDWALAVRPKERPQSVDELRAALDGRIEPPAVERHDTVASSSAPAPLANEATDFEPTRRMGGPGITTAFEPTMRVAAPRPAQRTQAAPTVAPVAAPTAAQTLVPTAAVTRRGGATVAPRTVTAAVPAPALASTTRVQTAVAAPAAAGPARSSRLGIVFAVVAILIGLGVGAAVRHFGLLGGSAATETAGTAAAPMMPPPAVDAAPATPTTPATPMLPTTDAPAAPQPAPADAAAPTPRPVVARENRTPAPALAEPAAAGPADGSPPVRSAATPAPEPRPRPAPARETVAAAPTPAPAAPAGPATASEACGSRILIALAMCLERECKNPRYSQQAECVKLQEQRRARELQ